MIYINSDKTTNIKLDDSNYFVAIDFDKTITSIQSTDSWDASGKMLGEEFKEKLYTLYYKYGPIEQDYNISYSEKYTAMDEWYSKCMNLYYEYGLTQEKLKISIHKSDLEFRKGAKEFLESMYKKNIPVIILSAGIGNVIEQFLKDNNCYYENMYIISNFLSFDENGNIKKYENPIIHTLNKSMEGKITKKFEEKIANKQYRLLFGDFIEDKKMIPINDWEKTIMVRIFREK